METIVIVLEWHEARSGSLFWVFLFHWKQVMDADADAVVRWAIRKDIPAMANLEATCDDGWDATELGEHMGQPYGTTLVAVLESEEQIIGHLLYERRSRAIRIVRLVVHPDFRRRGIGTTILLGLMIRISGTVKRKLVWDVPEHLLEVQVFLRSLGWQATAFDDVYRFEFQPKRKR